MKRLAGSILAAFAFSACAGEVDDGHDEVGAAELRIGTVADGVGCITVSVTGAGPTSVPPYAVTAGTVDKVLNLPSLPAGQVTIGASAWASCQATTGNAAWIADPVAVEIRAGVKTRVDLRFRQQGQVEGDVTFERSAVQLVAGGTATYALLGDGSVYAWGALTSTLSFGPAPVALSVMKNSTQLAAGDKFFCGIGADTTVTCVGDNSSGQLGIGSTTTSPLLLFTQVQDNFGQTLKGVRQLALGSHHACALTIDKVYCWGSNNFDQLGVEEPAHFTRAKVLSGLPATDPVVEMAAGEATTCALLASGRVHCWGNNEFGMLGRGSTPTMAVGIANPALPVETMVGSTALPLTGVVKIRPGKENMCALRADGTRLCWGRNAKGLFGDANVAAESFQNRAVALVPSGNVVDTESTRWVMCSVLNSGAVLCAGKGDNGTLGDGTGFDRSTNVVARGLANIVEVVVGGMTVTVATDPIIINKHRDHACALDVDGAVWCWGANGEGQLGTRDKTSRFVPTRVSMTN